MKKKMLLRIPIVIFLVALPRFPENYDNDPVFPTPAILKGNVAFWTKIYTEVSMSEGLLHDRDYPLVIFEKIAAESGSRTVKERRKRTADALTAIVSARESTWTDLERTIVALYKKEADSSALAGAADRVRFQQGQRERFIEGLKRSGMYLDTIRTILRAYNVPLRLAYLPHVESSFNTEAYSKVGAAGLWQFMRGTGKFFGMRIDYTIDERRDPVIASIAAAKYLSSSYAELRTWPLAITSYNHGVYGMKRAVAKTGSRDLAVIIQNYKSRSFQFASSNFYGCFLAASFIAENHAKFFPEVKMYRPLQYNDFVISHYIVADDFCQYLDIPREELMRLNPAIRPAVLERHQRLPKGYPIHIPANKPMEQVAALYDAIPDSLKTSAPPRPLYYRVNRGDNLYAIASRLGVTVRELAFENNITRLNRIRAGQVLRVPAKAAAAPTVLAQATEAPPGPAKASASSGKPGRAAAKPPGETPATDAAAEIARAEAEATVPPEEIAMVDSEKKQPPEERKYQAPRPTARKKKPAAAGEQPAQPALSDSLREIAFAPALIEPIKTASERPHVAPNFDVTIYDLDAVLSPVGTSAQIIVSVDETIGHYADWLGIPTWRIRKLNDMGRTSAIRINRSLLVPIDRPDALEQFVAARLEYHMAIEEDFYTQYTIADVTAYTLKRGEALWDICNNNENPLPLWLFKKYNRHLDLTKLFVGSEVWIPQVRERTTEELRSFTTTTPPPSPPPAPQLYRQRLHETKLVP
ncbi:MAG: transglycosylase SLT domain-containing protein [Chitinispirillaceae bacterium]|nr:transglycosylase SLT domain-containing protein [Chitinispirillaceae bacterium]